MLLADRRFQQRKLIASRQIPRERESEKLGEKRIKEIEDEADAQLEREEILILEREDFDLNFACKEFLAKRQYSLPSIRYFSGWCQLSKKQHEVNGGLLFSWAWKIVHILGFDPINLKNCADFSSRRGNESQQREDIAPLYKLLSDAGVEPEYL